MAYEVIARKWRPKIFSQIVGQPYITRTLSNAIKKDRVGHAYLFVGPRGIGKTTTARIFAKILNCEHPVLDASGDNEPCNQCHTCQEITTGSCLDVVEIDGASHNKVDDIRGIRDTVPYAPIHGRNYKIYIIDEVHMLTTGAWNALLKTLEEPPNHVKFFFATTEAHKVPATIISRCQRFDFKKLPVALIVNQISYIAEQEGIHIEENALIVIARAAEGSLRDAQSILDQMIAFHGSETNKQPITEKDVLDVFGLTSSLDIYQLIAGLIKNRPTDILTVIHRLIENGRNIEQLYTDILLSLRSLLIFHYLDQPQSILECNETEQATILQLKEISTASMIQSMIEGLIAYENNMRHHLNKQIFIETTLLRVMRESHSFSIDDLIGQLRKLQQQEKSSPGTLVNQHSAREKAIDPPTKKVSIPPPIKPQKNASPLPQTPKKEKPENPSEDTHRDTMIKQKEFSQTVSPENPLVKKVCNEFRGKVIKLYPN